MTIRSAHSLLALCLAGCLSAQATEAPRYEFHNGYPTAETVQRAYDDIDLNRAIQAYRFFYPNVAMQTLWVSNMAEGMVPNKVFALMQGNPNKIVFTANSDTPYSGMPLDLSKGPMVVELPPGILMGTVNDLNQEWVMDIGLPGPDAGKGGKHLVLPPGYQGEIPQGYFVGHATTNRAFALLRSLPVNGDFEAGFERIKQVKIYPLNKPEEAAGNAWRKFGDKHDFSTLSVEKGLDYWKTLHDLMDAEPVNPAYFNYYGELAELGIAKGKPFAPDARMQKILVDAAQIANAQMRVQSLSDRRGERVVWPDRRWEWAVLRPENGNFETPNYRDLAAREKWFYQAMIESPAMFRRTPGGGSLYWLGSRDAKGEYLDGGKTYRLRVPLPVPNKLFWSLTVYDSQTRSQVQTDQDKAALRSLFDVADAKGDSVDLYFGPQAPKGQKQRWIKTEPGQGWFTYFRVYGPEKPTFDGSWKPGDFERID